MNLIRSNLKPKEILSLTKAYIQDSKAKYDNIVKVKNKNFDNVVKELSFIDSEGERLVSELTFIKNVHPDKEIRDASIKATEKINDFSVDIAMREDIYKSILEAKEGTDLKELDAESEKLLEDSILDGKRSGLDLDKKTRTKIKKINKKLSQLNVKYDNNLRDDDTHIILTTDELKGLPEGYLKRTSIGDGKHKVTMEYPDYSPLMKLCDDAKVREQVSFLFNTRAKGKNEEIILKIIKLRDLLAKTLKYKTYPDYRLEKMMAKTPKRAMTLLKDLGERLHPLVKEELKVLETLKGDKIDPWDYGYYLNKLREEEYEVDGEEIRKYFPIEHVLKEMFRLYEDILGIKIKEVPIDDKWHEDVKYYEVSDGKVMGHFYMDLFARPNKYGHAAVWSLVVGSIKRDGTRELPLGALVTNFDRPTKDKPSLMYHGKVAGTLLHEFGHVMHLICSDKNRYGDYAGLCVKRDFVETPSQMIENWGFEKIVLKRLSKHYQTGEPLSDELIDKIRKAEKLGKARSWSGTISLSIFDQMVHSKSYSKKEIYEMWDRLHHEYMMTTEQKGISKISNWGHLASGGYGSLYYSYVWAKVISVDLYTRFQEADSVISPMVGREYRDKILAVGATREEEESVTDFLGRKFNTKSFIRYLTQK